MKANLRFAIIPKVDHPWFDEVHEGARTEAALLERELGIFIEVDYLPPAAASVDEQSMMLDEAARRRVRGVAIDPVDTLDAIAGVVMLRQTGIPLIVFDSPSPEAGTPGIGNDFAEQGRIAAEHLVGLIAGRGKVAIMQGVPTAPNHRQRLEAQVAVLREYPGVTIVDGGTDNDDIPTAREQALAVLTAHPDLTGYLCCDAAGPIGIADAIRETGKTGSVTFVGMDGIRPILEAINDGVMQASSSTIPRVQGAMAILMLLQAAIHGPLPRTIDTGIDVITRENVVSFLARTPSREPHAVI